MKRYPAVTRIRLTDEDKKQLQAIAEHYGVKEAEAVRHSIRNEYVRIFTKPLSHTTP